ncbi:MAG TPA: multicopper oxidase domain-containing protein [Cyclobacteriaceae bacterium]|nr:multicopper oxidase domain-containing protein [Cyclobacteriaceae bacterium]HMV07459.1 multicopper oxidase domain-containing protein [Cyclobacteriaceae bacterium]HMW99186.1 multicopper oxidase domain-containing protein [Cyclobacteriaceae bacterium]HMX48181.1 multicopper oxidase domain-containing protein [Cyclobacteriaceae bacterium]HMY94986.1 multicopper oxidase domain-containing protein [Cyclobacteriaceae bacterium]
MKRRDFIKRSALSALTAWVGSSILSACHTEEDMIGEPNWIVEGSFDRPLTIPAVSNGSASLNAQFSVAELLKGQSSTTLSYANGLLGPTIKANAGETVNVSLQNSLSEETNIHWHGLILPENMDGHPKDVASAGGSLNYSLPIIQRAGTYWYHPHPHGVTAKQVFMGLAGMFIVNDPEETALNLPSGEFEVPLIIQDKHFEGNNLEYSPSDDEIMTGYLGEQILVNGQHAPFLSVASRWYRVRILNGSTARVYNLALTGGRQMTIIGSDGGLLVSPETVSSIMLGPGERIDVLVDFSGLAIGKEIYLVSNKFSEYNVQGRQSFSLLKFKVDRTETSNFTLPSSLSNISPLNPSLSVKTRTLDIAQTIGGDGGHGGMGRHSINGKIFEMDRVDETVSAGTTEIWEFDNRAGDEIHPMHIHGVQFQVLERTGGRNKLIASEKGWKDTILLMPREKVRVIMTFPNYTGVFVFHCHNLEHEDDGMMLNYEII